MMIVTSPPTPETVALRAALVRVLATTTAPKYLRDAATAWLAKQAATPPPAA